MTEQREIIEIPARSSDSQTISEKLRVAAYCRVSTSQEAQQNSYQVQKAYYLEKIESNPDWVLADIFADQGISGTSVRRPEFQRMIRWCKKGKIDIKTLDLIQDYRTIRGKILLKRSISEVFRTF